MNAALLLEHYESIAEAPDAIARLRRFILDLAVRGKLVEQDPNDEPASELHSRLAREFQSASAPKGRGRRSAIAASLMDEPPYPAPTGWHWCTMGELGETNVGLTYSPSDLHITGIPVLRSNNIQNRQIVFSDLARVTSKPKASVMANEGDILICARNGSRALVGKAAIIERLPEPMAFGAFMTIFRSPLNRYLHLFLTSPLFRQVLDEVNTNTINQITQGNLRSTLVPLPPLTEQHRIVAKVDELMALCEQLEGARTEREMGRDKLTLSTLAKLNEPDPEAFTDDARFALEHLEPLTKRTDQIKQLRQTILNLAVRGKLVAQDAADEPASTQTRGIFLEREELVRAKLLRREKPLEPVREDELPFEIPAGWLWSRIGDAVLFTQYGTSEKAHPSERGVPVLTMGNIQDGTVRWGHEKRIPETSGELPSLYLQRFDLLYNRTNSAELVGKTGIYLGDDDCRTFASYLIRIRCSQTYSLPTYVNLAMNASVFRETQIVPLIKQQTGQANVNGTALKNMLIPLPPLAEQRRIVAKVDELMALCDQLEASLVEGEQTRSKLLEAVLHEALAPA